MGFKEWLNEEVDVSSALKEKAEKGLTVKTKFGSFKFDKMDKKKYLFVLDGEDKDVRLEVTAKPNDKCLDVTVSVFKGDELIGKRKSDKEEKSDVHYEKSDVTKKAIKDIKKAVESVMGSLNEEEIIRIDEDMGLTAIATALSVPLLMTIPALAKAAMDNNWFGVANEKSTKIKSVDEIAEKIKNMSLEQTQKLLKDERKVDAIVSEIIETIKKESPRFILNPRTKGELYDKVLFYLRRNAEAKSKGQSSVKLADVKDAAKQTLARSSGYTKGGVFFGKQV